jgi:2-haloalkanoic acid dehalogenase type II
MAQVNTILFDLGNTLIYFDGDWQEMMSRAIEALHQTLDQHGINLPIKEFQQAFWQRLQEYYLERDSEFIEYTTRYVLQDLLEQWGHPDVPAPIIHNALDAMYAVSQEHWIAESDAHKTLQTLREKGYRMSIISNAADDRDVQALVDKAGFRSYFEMILSSAAAGIRKPNPRIFEMVLSQMDVHPDQAVMVGDMLGADILGARNAGILDIWITRRANTAANRAHKDTIQPSLKISTLSELPGIIQSLD